MRGKGKKVEATLGVNEEEEIHQLSPEYFQFLSTTTAGACRRHVEYHLTYSHIVAM